MRFEFKPSFDRSVRNFKRGEKEEIKKVAIDTIDILSHHKMTHKGIGLKRLKGNFWEARIGLNARILFRSEKDLVEFILVGDHNDIKRFLRNI